MGEAQSELLFPVAGYARPCDRQPLYPPTVPTPGNRRARLRGTTRRRHDRRGGHGARDPELVSKSRQAALEFRRTPFFAPVWTTLYLLMGLALVLARRADPARSPLTEIVFGLQLALNCGLEPGLLRPARPRSGTRRHRALVGCDRRDHRRVLADAAPCGRAWPAPLTLAWVTFATILNAEIWRLNE